MTEIWAAVIGAVVVAGLSVLITYRISYPLGVAQGKKLALHEKSIDVLTEIRRRLLDLRNEWADWVSGLPSEDEDRSKRLLSKQKALEEHYEENKIVLSNKMQDKIERIVYRIDQRWSSFQMNLMMSNLGSEEEQRDRQYRAGAEIQKWLDHEFSEYMRDLDSHLREIIGTDDLDN